MGNEMLSLVKLLQGRLRQKSEYAILELHVEDGERDEERDCWFFFDPEFQTYHRLDYQELVAVTIGDSAAQQLILHYTWKKKFGD